MTRKQVPHKSFALTASFRVRQSPNAPFVLFFPPKEIDAEELNRVPSLNALNDIISMNDIPSTKYIVDLCKPIHYNICCMHLDRYYVFHPEIPVFLYVMTEVAHLSSDI